MSDSDDFGNEGLEAFDDLDLDTWFCSECPVKVKNTGDKCLLCGADNPANGGGMDVVSESKVAEENKWTQREQQFLQDAKEGDSDKIAAHIAAGIGINLQDPNGETALMQASYWGNQDVIEQLLDAKADVNHVGYKEGSTALMRASKSSKCEAVKLLIKAGADVTIQNHAGQRAFDLAGAFDDTASIPIKKLLTAELHRWVNAHLEKVCSLPKKACAIILQFHCPEFMSELDRETEMRRLKDAENDHKTDDKTDASQEAQREMRERQLRQEYGSQRRQHRWRQRRYDDDYY